MSPDALVQPPNPTPSPNQSSTAVTSPCRSMEITLSLARVLRGGRQINLDRNPTTYAGTSEHVELLLLLQLPIRRTSVSFDGAPASCASMYVRTDIRTRAQFGPRVLGHVSRSLTAKHDTGSNGLPSFRRLCKLLPPPGPLTRPFGTRSVSLPPIAVECPSKPDDRIFHHPASKRRINPRCCYCC